MVLFLCERNCFTDDVITQVEFCSFPKPQELIVHSTVKKNDRTKIVAYFEHDIGETHVYNIPLRYLTITAL